MRNSELKELLERATKGPWRAKQTRGNNIYEHTVTNAPTGYLEICQLSPDPDTKRSDDIKQATMITANADLIALTPTLAAELLRCRELLALVVAQGDTPCRSAYNLHEIRAMAKKYLTETEG